MKYFIADNHFNHKNIIEACDRPFKSIKAMNEHMINEWNSVIGNGDLVYHLGDIAYNFGKNWNLNKSEENQVMGVDVILNQLNGQKILILGNHDEKNNIMAFKHLFAKITHMEYIKLSRGDRVMLCHYPMVTWRNSHYNAFHLHGHSHGGVKPAGKMLDVGVDNIGYKPVSEEWIAEIMDGKPDNVNYINKSLDK